MQNEQQKKLLAYHVDLISLLASCAEGENRYIESICQTIFTLDELITIIGDFRVDTIHKTSYVEYVVPCEGVVISSH